MLAHAIAQVTPAASRDDTLPMLTAVNLELDGTTMTLAATDRYRLAVRELELAPGARGRRPGQGSVPRAGQDAERRGPDDDPRHRGPDHGAPAGPGEAAHDGQAGPGAAEAMIGFEAGERRLTTRLLAGEFVRYRSRFPEEFGCTADLPAEAFAEAVRRVALVAERGTPVQLSFAPDRVTIGAATQGQARARETVAADFSGGEPAIAFSPQYLLDGIIAAAQTHPHHGGPHAADATPSPRGSGSGSPAPPSRP